MDVRVRLALELIRAALEVIFPNGESPRKGDVSAAGGGQPALPGTRQGGPGSRKQRIQEILRERGFIKATTLSHTLSCRNSGSFRQDLWELEEDGVVVRGPNATWGLAPREEDTSP